MKNNEEEIELDENDVYAGKSARSKTLRTQDGKEGNLRAMLSTMQYVYLLLTLAWVIVSKRRVGAFINDGEESSTMKEVKTDYGLVPLYVVDFMWHPSSRRYHMSDVANGYLETILDWIPGMENIRLRDFPSFIQTKDIDDTMLNYMIRKAAAIIVLNTFDALEHDSVNALTVTNPQTFNIGPLDLMQQHICNERVNSLGRTFGRKSKLHRWARHKRP
ncbi:hypothetical protein Tco_0058164 [Tanacetum coccineum]